MSEASQQLAEKLENSVAELEAFSVELQSGLDPIVYSQFTEWVTAQASESTARIWEVVAVRCNRLAALENQANEGETREQAQARIRSYFQQVNPGPIAQELQHACSLDVVRTTYDYVLTELTGSKTIGPIVRRYHLPSEAVSALASACIVPLHPALSSLGVHAGQVRSHGELLQTIASESGVRTGVGLAASIAGGLLLGPLGAIGAKLITSVATDPTARINASIERVGDTFEGFRASFVAAMEAVDTNVLYTLVSLYGGMLLRVEQDLNAVGKRLAAIDLSTGAVHLGLSPAALRDYDSWARTTLDQLRLLRNREQWGQLGDAADKALRLTVADPLRANVTGDDENTSYAVEFARMRAAALNQAAATAWSDGKINEACALYRHLLTSTNIAWERDAQVTPADEEIYLAGLRLAISATRGGSRWSMDDLAALPLFVAQAVSRFASTDSEVCAPGEALAGATVMGAVAIATFAEEYGHDLGLSGRLPELVRRMGGLTQWEQLRSQVVPSPSHMLLLLDGELPATDFEVDDSEFMVWLRTRAAIEERRETVRGCIILALLGAGVLVGGYFLVRWLFF